MVKTTTHLQIRKPKTASTWTRKYLVAHHGGKTQGNGHDAVWMLPARGKLDGLVKFGTDRDPGSWYCSWYLHALHSGPHQLAVYGGGSVGFRDVLYGATHVRARACPQDVMVICSTDRRASDAFAASRFGLWSWSSLYMYGTEAAWQGRDIRWDVDFILDQCQSRSGIAELFGDDPALADQFPDTNSAANRGHRAPKTPDRSYRFWFDAEMLEWVYEADGWLMEIQGRPGAFSPARTPLMRVRKVYA